MELQAAAQDAVGSMTLAALAAARRYNRWQVDVLKPYLGKRILEIGSGIGNISTELLDLDPDRMVLTDIDPWYRNRLTERFGTDPRVRIDSLTLPDPDVVASLGSEKLDTAIALNVVEHIEDHVGAVRSMADALVPGGRVVILVPALQWIYGRMDEELGHFRRYNKESLRAVLESAGLQVESLFWFNRAGVIPWWWRGRVLRKPALDGGGIAMFNKLVPIFRLERFAPLPFGQSVVGIGRKAG